ncbi:MAG TPA: nucleotidyltransferase family protein [Burkholderiales bacterium]|nr:nucleotidyltransferase family protein [Burkholderiales bacterium]
MTVPDTDIVSLALRDPRALPGWPLARWEALVRQARRANLLSRLAVLLDADGLLQSVPEAPRAHLDAARTVSQAQEEAVRREVAYVYQALAPTGAEIVLLKGAAYLFAGLPAARGRVFSDVDILVPGVALGQVEAALMLHGWATTHHDPYDQRYYRRWMHELPPMQHITRGTVLDVHHAILPTTARLKPDSAKLLAASRPLAGEPRLRVLAPADMVLHSATHLFFNEELGSGLRDLADLDSLLRHFGRQPGFWEQLAGRAREMDLTRPLYYALRYATRILRTPVPATALRAAEIGRPSPLLRRLMDVLYLRALRPDHPGAADRLTPLARHSLYVRAHWLRMPPVLLVYHLGVKAFRRESPGTA